MQLNKAKNVIEIIRFIEWHLAEKLTLDMVAKAVHYSKYHLHRMFTDTVGLTLHDYLQRRRLTEAARLLVFSEKPILDIALEAGYGSQQAFSDIFKAMYKRPPYGFRKNEEFYPLQLEYEFGEDLELLNNEKIAISREIFCAEEKDIPLWMHLVRLVVDGFPHLQEKEHLGVLRRCIREKRAFIMKENALPVGIMMICPMRRSIDFLGIHPFFRKQGMIRSFLDRAVCELSDGGGINITTFREGDQADTGYRKVLKKLGFVEAELLTEFGYPTQRMILSRRDTGS